MLRTNFTADNLYDEYRVGLLGPSGCGKTSLVAKLVEKSRICCGSRRNEIDERLFREVSMSESVHDGAKVISVIVKKVGPLGIKVGNHRKFSDFACIKSFSVSPNGDKLELELDGRIKAGDLLIAIDRTNLVCLPISTIRSILRESTKLLRPRVLTFIRPDLSKKSLFRSIPDGNNPYAGVGGGFTSPADRIFETAPCADTVGSHRISSADESSMDSTSTIAQGLYVDQQEVNLRVITIPMEDNRKCVTEVVDIPGIDASHCFVSEWVQALDAVVLVYAADAPASLSLLKKRYLPLVSELVNKEAAALTLPLALVCNKCDCDSHCPSSHGGESSAARSPLLRAVLEGRELAKEWGAQFFCTCLGPHPTSLPPHITLSSPLAIFQQVIHDVDTQSPVIPIDSLPRSFAGWGSFMTSCVSDGCANPPLPKRRRKECLARNAPEELPGLSATVPTRADSSGRSGFASYFGNVSLFSSQQLLSFLREEEEEDARPLCSLMDLSITGVSTNGRSAIDYNCDNCAIIGNE